MSFFGQNLRFLRNSRQISQTAFAEVFGLKRTAVGAYEEERAEPKLDLLVKIANYFGVSLEDILCQNLQTSFPRLPLRWLMARRIVVVSISGYRASPIR